MVTSFRSAINGRTSPDLSSETNGSRPAPSNENTSRTSWIDWLAESGRAVVSRLWPAAGTAARMPITSRLLVRTGPPRRPGLRPARRCGCRRRRLHVRPHDQPHLQHAAQRVAQQALRLLGSLMERQILRYHDALQARDVGQKLADLVEVPVHLEAVPVGVERMAGLDGERLELAERDAADFGARGNILQQRRNLVLLGDEAPHQRQVRLVLSHLAPQVVHRAAGE